MPRRKAFLLASFIIVVIAGLAFFGYRYAPLFSSGGISSPSTQSSAQNAFSASNISSAKEEVIQITETRPATKELLRSAKTITIEGKARDDIHTIRAWKFCEGDDSGFEDIPVIRGQWSFMYTVAPMGICWGRNSIVFQSTSHCPEYYSPHCKESKWFEMDSDTGYLYPYTVRITGESRKSSEKMILSGIADSSVDGIDAHIHCMSAETFHSVHLQRPAGVNREWNWELPLTIAEKTLCRGQMLVSFWSSTRCTIYCNFNNQRKKRNATYLFFDEGYFPPEKEQAEQQMLALQKNVITEVSDDPSVQTIISTELLTPCDEQERTVTLPKVVVPTKKLDENLSVQLTGSGTRASLEFILNVEDDSQEFKVPQTIAHNCNDAKVYYLGPDRIIVRRGYGFISEPYIWDGNQWKTPEMILKGQAPFQTILDIGEVNKEYFVIQEVRFGDANPVVMGRWARYVIDVETLKIVDVFFDDR